MALKTLPETFTRDADRRARLEREARLLASLNHPNVASLPVRDALDVARQVAEGLEAAHRKGIIHRDLKPGNVKLTPEGRVKVLDFGLAKALGAAAASDPQQAETVSRGETGSGVVLGTAAYMSPEQARGEELDERTDVWSFGCVLYETLTGRRAFAGATASDSLAAVLEHAPEWSVLPPSTPAIVRTLLRLCLQKERARRLQSITDARLEIEEALTTPETASPTAATVPPVTRRRWPWLVPAFLGLATALWLIRSYQPAPRPVTRLAISLPPGASIDVEPNKAASVALALDGSRVAYVVNQDGRRQIYVRERDKLESTPVPGTEGPDTDNPFFSADGRWIGFNADGKLKKVPLSGGRPVDLCPGGQVRGAAWGPDDAIVFTPGSFDGLRRVSAAGGPCEVLTVLDRDRNEKSHRFPQILPGGELVLFTVVTFDIASFDEARIEVVSLKTGERRVVLEGGKHARYVPTGHLLYGRHDSLFAVPFDLDRLQVTGPPAEVLKGVSASATSGELHFSVSTEGSLAYLPGGLYGMEGRLVWVDRRGTAQALGEERRGFLGSPVLSPDGKRLALMLATVTDQIWVHDLVRSTWTRLTFGPDSNMPVWTPDGSRVTFRSDRDTEQSGMELYWQAADASGAAEKPSKEPVTQDPHSWLPDGRGLAVMRLSPSSGGDIWLLRFEDGGKARPLLSERFNEMSPRFSPDGRWLAYVSDESGRSEVYVRPFPELRPRWQISTTGGTVSRWARSGRELFYRDGDKMMAVNVTTTPTFRAGKPRLLFSGNYAPPYDVAPDGQRFVMIEESERPFRPTQVDVVHNWFEELKRLAPAR